MATSELDAMMGLVKLKDACLRRPSSSAAVIEMALASPIPFTDIRSFTVSFPNSFRLSLPSLRMSLASSMALFSRLPVLIRMANNSESLKEAEPLDSNFSLGLSSFAHCFIEYFCSCTVLVMLIFL